MINDVSEYIQHVLGATGQSDGGDEPADAHAHHSVYYAELPPIRCETCVRLHSQLLCCGLISTRIRSAEHALEQCAIIRHFSSSRCTCSVRLHSDQVITSLLIHGIQALLELGYIDCAVRPPFPLRTPCRVRRSAGPAALQSNPSCSQRKPAVLDGALRLTSQPIVQ